MCQHAWRASGRCHTLVFANVACQSGCIRAFSHSFRFERLSLHPCVSYMCGVARLACACTPSRRCLKLDTLECSCFAHSFGAGSCLARSPQAGQFRVVVVAPAVAHAKWGLAQEIPKVGDVLRVRAPSWPVGVIESRRVFVARLLGHRACLKVCWGLVLVCACAGGPLRVGLAIGVRSLRWVRRVFAKMSWSASLVYQALGARAECFDYYVGFVVVCLRCGRICSPARVGRVPPACLAGRLVVGAFRWACGLRLSAGEV